MSNPHSMQKIQVISRRYLWLINTLIVVAPMFTLLFWLMLNELPVGLLDGLPHMPQRPLSATALALGFAVSLILLGIILYGLLTLRSLFQLYEKSIVFSQENVQYIRKFGYTLIAWVIGKAIFIPLISVVITYSNPPGERAVTFSFGAGDLAILVIGGVIIVISWIMNEGRAIESEHALTI